jgi:hypothetical protein
MTVWDFAEQYAQDNYASLARSACPLSAKDVLQAHEEALTKCRGLENKHWCFVFKADGGGLFESGHELPRRMIASAKCASVSRLGGMVLSVEVTGWGTPQETMHAQVWAVCPPGGEG